MNTIMLHKIISLASGIMSDYTSDNHVQILTAILNSKSRPVWNLLPPVVEAMGGRIDIPDDLRKQYLLLMAEHLQQITWISWFGDMLMNSVKKPVMLLKGHGLLGRVYKEEYPRFSSDIDILVGRQDYDQIMDVLLPHAAGYKETPKHALIVLKTPYNIQIEIHKTFSEIRVFDIEFEDIWVKAQPHGLFKNRFIQSMSLEDALIHCVIHSYNHLKLYPYMIADIIRLFRHSRMNTNLLFEKARSYGCYDMMNCITETIQKEYLQNTSQIILQHNFAKPIKKSVCTYIFQEKSSKTRNHVKPLLKWFLLDKPHNMIRAFISAIQLLCHRVIKKMNRLGNSLFRGS